MRRGVTARRAFGVLGALLLSALPGGAAEIASDHPAAIVVFPKLLVDTEHGLDTMIRISNVAETPLSVFCFYVNVTPICTLEGGSCFPDALSCSLRVDEQTLVGGCSPQWQPTDFLFRLTREQPTGWLVSRGERTDCRFIDGVCSHDGTTVCDRDSQCLPPGSRCVQPACLPLDGGLGGRTGPGGQTNEGAVPLSPEDPFIGELKCIAVDETGQPTARNDLIGEVLIGKVLAGPDRIQLAGYNAVGIPAIIPSTNNRDDTLVLGGEGAEYDGCPNILILDHYFDGAVDPVIQNICLPDMTCSVSKTECTSDSDCIDNVCVTPGVCSVTGTACGGAADCVNACEPDNECRFTGERCLDDEDCVAADFQVRLATEVTLIPCTQDFEGRDPALARVTVQFLVFNEFEQRLSTSIPIDCFKEIQLSNIDTTQNDRSIFSAGVAGTLTGQTRIRGVQNESTAGRGGNTLLGVAEEFRCAGAKFEFPACNLVDSDRLVSVAAKNLHFQGRRPQSDFIYLP